MDWGDLLKFDERKRGAVMDIGGVRGRLCSYVRRYWLN